jgi:Integrase zinc binding domain
MELMKKILYVSIEKVTRAVNGEADVLAKLAKELGEATEPEIHIIVRNRRTLSLCQTTDDANNEDIGPRRVEYQEAMITEEDDDCRQLFIEYFRHGTFPKDKKKADQLRKWVLRYTYVGDTLYRRSYDQLWLRCVPGSKAKHVMKEIHSGLCGAHQSGPKMKLKIKRMGYYWSTMVTDCEAHTKKCCMCQIHDPFIHQAPNPLHPRLDKLDAMDEKRLMAQQNLEIYQAKMARAYDKMARVRAFQQGELVLVLKRPIIGRHIGPIFFPNWEGPYVIEKVYGGGAYQLIDHEGERPMPPINGRYLKKYYTEPRLGPIE